jgi:cytochrome c-type biogenesis protein CcmF
MSRRPKVALRRGFADDLYVVLAGYEAGGQSAKMKVTVNPLVNWIWLGVGVMAVGTFIALLPARAFAFAAQPVPEGAATTTLVLLLLFGVGSAGLPGTASAESRRGDRGAQVAD